MVLFAPVGVTATGSGDSPTVARDIATPDEFAGRVHDSSTRPSPGRAVTRTSAAMNTGSAAIAAVADTTPDRSEKTA
jgi:hypothetical protein